MRARAASYGVPAEAVDGMDVLAVEDAVRRAAEAVRSGDGPHFVEFKTYRFRAHSMADPDLYRTKEEIERWKERDPIDLFVAPLREQGLLDDAGLAEIEVSRRGGDRRGNRVRRTKAPMGAGRGPAEGRATRA